MRRKQSFWYAVVLLIMLCGILVGGWSWSRFLNTGTTHRSTTRTGIVQKQQIARVTHHNALIVTPTIKSTGVATPTPRTKSGNAQHASSFSTSRGGNAAYIQGPLNNRLIIPAIGVNAPIESVGTGADGALEVPKINPWDGVGLYQDGPKPGDPGNAVIDGHLDRPGGSPAAFWNLRYLHPGDTVTVIDGQGNTVNFRVTRLHAYSPQEAPLQDIFGAASGIHLNLITCAGTWIPALHQTTQRLVVYTTLAAS